MSDMSASEEEKSGSNGEPPKGNPNVKDILDKPIPGPTSAGPRYLFETDYERPLSYTLRTARFFADLVRVPTAWIRENIVEPNKGPKYYYYHRKYPRALPIDECYMDDVACIHEAELEFQRLHAIDRATLDLLRDRRDACQLWYKTQKGQIFFADECQGIVDTYNREETNFHIKYGDLHFNSTVMHAYNKQKHRMIVDRRRALRKEQEALEK